MTRADMIAQRVAEADAALADMAKARREMDTAAQRVNQATAALMAILSMEAQ